MTHVALLGYGRFGRAFGELVTEAGFHLRAYDPYTEVPEALRANSVAELTAGADLVVVAVPVPVMTAAVAELAPHLTPEQLVLDVGSVKVRPVAALDGGLGARVPWVGTHPLFGPLSLTLAERPLRVVICPNDVHPEAARRARVFYESLGCVIIEQSAEEHDRAMARTHALAFFIAKGVIDADKALADDPPPFVPPSFQGLARTMQSVRADAGHLYRALHQDNPFSADVRQALIEALVHADRNLTNVQVATTPESMAIPDLGTRSPELHEARAHIDQLDRDLLVLLRRRADLAARAGRAKRALGHGVLDTGREAELLNQRRRWAEEQGLDPAAVDDVFQAILRLSRSVQRQGD
ncbi:prephenate dehydrogenase/arogenate dehydrogenase family protein [Pendulispora rubella]|uniref:chorismate mutase n=1 Tax=Pendulispora rubella TaxID=2741070 RepID=A0ABZ2L9T7_9BACT